MRFRARSAAVLALGLALAASPASARDAARRPAPAAPADLRPFLLRADEPVVHVFSRTPSFAWRPVRGARRYEFELAKSARFGDGELVWTSDSLRTPAVAVPLALPWTTGAPYAFYARVRASTQRGTTAWSQPFGFNLRWTQLPAELPSYPGLVRWTPVEGATRYDVWFVDAKKVVSTRTNAADEREYYSFHQDSGWTGAIHWRVRAVRAIYGALPNRLPTVAYGPWSPTFTASNPSLATGPLAPLATASDTVAAAGTTTAFGLTPGFAWSGDAAADGTAYELYRPYVFSDQDCVNVVFRGSIVGSPAFVPRATGPLSLPTSSATVSSARVGFLPDGTEPMSYMADTSTLTPTEQDPSVAAGDASPAGAADGGGAAGASSASDPVVPKTAKLTGAPVDLWDSGWPDGRFFWTVVPVKATVISNASTTLAQAGSAGDGTIVLSSTVGFSVGSQITIGTGATQETASVSGISGSTVTLDRPLASTHPAGAAVVNLGDVVEYHDAELPQDACAAGRIASFGKVSEPVVTSSSAPFASGLSPKGRLVAAAGRTPSFYGQPLVAWQPALGADQYEVQWSRTGYPWRPFDAKGNKLSTVTSGTAALLALTPGTWFYRVRGLDLLLPGTARAMSWSNPVKLRVARPRFTVVKR